MTTPAILITGAAGEMGYALLNHLGENRDIEIVALDLNQIDPSQAKENVTAIKGSVVDASLLQDLSSKYTFKEIFHLAGVLSTGAEKDPTLAHRVNVEGSFGLLNIAREHALRSSQKVKFIFPSTIAVYGIDRDSCDPTLPVDETQHLSPITMYGINKRYVEQMGRYYSKFFQLLDDSAEGRVVDFRAIRFPGILSAETVPTGGTSDYAPEMLHAAASGKPYACFVKPETRLPFMTMPDAVRAIIMLETADPSKLTRVSYNINAFSVSAAEIEAKVRQAFPDAQISYSVDSKRLKIVESWPEQVSDQRARDDWGWNAEHSFNGAFSEYLIPAIKKRYS